MKTLEMLREQVKIKFRIVVRKYLSSLFLVGPYYKNNLIFIYLFKLIS